MRCRFFVATIFVSLLLIQLTTSGCRADEPIRIGFLAPMTGPMETYGTTMAKGLELALEEINSTGGFRGRKVEAVVCDTELNPNKAVEIAKRLIQVDKVDVLTGIVSSDVVKAVAPVANDLTTPLIVTLAMTPDITGKECNPYVFRVTANVSQNIKAAAEIAADTSARTWTTVGPAYTFGHQCWEYFQRYLKAKRPDVSFSADQDYSFIGINSQDFKPVIDRIKNRGTEGVLVSLYSVNLSEFIAQGKAAGLFDGKRVFLFNIGYTYGVLRKLGPEMPNGLWFGGLYWFRANENPANMQFVASYVKRFGVFPDHASHSGYAGVKTYLAAIEKAGSTDKESVRKALEGLSLELPVGPITIRAEDHQAVTDVCWGQTSGYDGKWKCTRLDPIRVFPGIEVTEAVDQTGCTRNPGAVQTPSDQTDSVPAN